MTAREDMYIQCILSTHAQTRSCAWWRQLKTHSNAKPGQATLRHASHVSCSRRALLAGTCHNHMRQITGHLATNRPYFKTKTIQLLYEAFVYLLMYLLTPVSRVLLEKLTGSQLVKKFPAFYGNRRFITAFTRARHVYLRWAISIQSVPIPLPSDPL
jgi:hypothetical protein